MTDCGTEAVAAAFRSGGLQATVRSPPDDRTLEIFLGPAGAYQRTTPHLRRHPPWSR